MFSLAQAHRGLTREGRIADEQLQERSDTNMVNLMDQVEASTHDPCTKRAWVEYLSEHPEPLSTGWNEVDEPRAGSIGVVGRRAAYSVRMHTKRELVVEEDRLWSELHALVESLPADLVAAPGYFPEGWSAKDLLAHIGSWLAEAGVILEQIRFGTYRPEEIIVDAMNRTFYEAMKDVPFTTVRSQAQAARSRMLRAWGALPDDTTAGDRWIRKAGPEHYAEHLPRLKEWLAELGSKG